MHSNDRVCAMFAIGLVLFLTGVNVGFMPVGSFLGESIAAHESYSWLLIPIAMLIGYFIVSAEPAVHVLNRQVEEIIGMEQRGELFVVRPNGPLPIRRVEKDPAKLQAVYDLGAEAGRASLSGLKEYLLTHE